jgi:hypothetical protein
MFLVYHLVISFLGGLGAIACVIGVIVTAPFTFIAVAVAYKDVFADGQPVAPAPGVEAKPDVSANV